MNTARKTLFAALLTALTITACGGDDAGSEPMDTDYDAGQIEDASADDAGATDASSDTGTDTRDARADAYVPKDAGEAYWRTLGDAATVDPATVPALLNADLPECEGKLALPGDLQSTYRVGPWGSCSFLCETYAGMYAERRRVSDLRGVCAALGGVCAGAVGDALCIPAP